MQLTRRRVWLGGALALAGCTVSPAPSAVLRVATPSLPATRGDPFMGLTLPQTLPADQLYDTLTLLGPDGSALPALATAWESLEARRWRFTLREDATFASGRPVDSAAVAAIVRMLQDGKARRSSAATDLAVVAGAEADGRGAITITTRAPAPLLPAALSVLRLPDPAALQSTPPEQFAAAPVGSGPYRAAEWTQNRLYLQRRDHPWRQGGPEALHIFAMPDEIARTQALLSGAVDLALNVAPDDAAVLEAAGARLQERASTSLALICFITNRGGPLANWRVRAALNHAIDRDELIKAFLGARTAPAGQLASADAFGRDPAIAAIPYEPDRARAWLQEAGHGSGLSLSLTCVVGLSPNDGGVYQQIAAEWRKIGVTLRIDRVPMAQLQRQLFGGGWKGDMFAMGLGGFDALRSFRMLSCTWPASWHCDPEVGALVKRASEAETRTERATLTQAALRADRESYSCLYLWQQVVFDALGPRLAALPLERAAMPLERARWRS